MPIRFRCAYCNQLMGIARRKAGTIVRCPRCAGQVIVPDPGPEGAAQEAVPPSNGPAPETPRPTSAPGPVLFEQSDFEKLFEPGPLVPPAPPQMAPPQVAAPPPYAPPQAVAPLPAYDPAPIPAAAGLFLTPAKLTILSVAVVILLGLAFFLGMLVGRS